MILNALSIFTDMYDFWTAEENNLMIKVVFGSLLIGLLILLIIRASRKEGKLSQSAKIKKMVAIAIFSALSIVLYFVKFNIPTLFPGFLEIQFSNVPALIGGFMFGPSSGAIIIFVRTIVKLPMTSTVGVGEFADLIIGVAVVLVSSLTYHKHKTRKRAALSLVYGSLVWVITSMLANWIILTPFYILLYFGGSTESFAASLSVIPGINESNYMYKYLFYGILPFNLLLSTMVSFVTFLIYKRIAVFIRSLSDTREEIEPDNN